MTEPQNSGAGIVLGAGGPVGWPYHLGVIEGIREALGKEPANADFVVGTSAGGAIAASLLAGASTDDVLAVISVPPSEAERELMRERRNSILRHPIQTLKPLSLKMARRGGVAGLVGLAPAGLFPSFPMRRFPVADLEDWPGHLWLPSVRVGDGEVVVFGRDHTDTPIIDAIEATSAVPLMFQPKQIGGERYVDGAVASSTHADLLADQNLRVVVISSPMTRPGGGMIRRRARRQLEAEVAALEAAGTTVVVFEPDEAFMAAVDGYPRRDPTKGPEVVATARAQAVEQLTRIADQLRGDSEPR